MKVLYKILAGILSLISFAAFLLVASLFASYYIDALSFVYHSDKVVKDACIFAAVTILALIVLICIIVSAIKAKRHYLSAIVALVLVIVLAFPMFFTGLALIIINGTNGCSYTEDAANYGKYDGKYSPEHFPESITEDMSVVAFAYFYKPVDTFHSDFYLEVKFNDRETMERYLEAARASFADNGIVTYQNPYDARYTDMVENSCHMYTGKGERYINYINFRNSDDYQYVEMIYYSVSYSYEELIIIYNSTDIGSDIEVGDDPDSGEYYPRFLKRFNVECDPVNDFVCNYSEDESQE